MSTMSMHLGSGDQTCMTEDHSFLTTFFFIRLGQMDDFFETLLLEIKTVDLQAMASRAPRRMVLEEFVKDGTSSFTILDKQVGVVEPFQLDQKRVL